MRPALASMIAGVLLAGCAGLEVDRMEMSTYDRTPGGFVYAAQATWHGYGKDDPAAEKIRMDWLQKYLDLNGHCRNGYDIAERDVMVLRETLIEPVYRIRYVGKCR